MSPAITKHAWAAWAAFWWILLENAALGFPCAICNLLGTDNKETIVYELVLLALCIAMDVWCGKLASSYPVLYGDNDSVKFVLICGTGLRDVASAIMQLPLETEVHFNTNIWFARVLTETNKADVPSRFLTHPFLDAKCDGSSRAFECLTKFLCRVKLVHNELKHKEEQPHLVAPRVKKRRREQTFPWETAPAKTWFKYYCLETLRRYHHFPEII